MMFFSLFTVPAPTNISVVCQNFVNVLYWNYSKPTEHLEFLVTVKPYSGELQTLRTAQTYLNISEYSSDVSDSYYVTVRAYDGQEESNLVFNKFTYSKDLADDNTHKCSVNFPAINTSIHKDVISVFFSHPYNIYEQSGLLEDFDYRITYNRNRRDTVCYEEEDLCTTDIHFEENLTGKCVELKFEGMVDVLFTTTYKNVCVSEIRNDSIVDNPSYIAAVVGGGVVILFIFVGFMWLLWKKWSKISKLPEALLNIWCSQRSTFIIHLPVTVLPTCHVPLLEQQEFEACDSLTISPLEKDITIIPTDTEVVMVPETSAASEEDVNFEESEDYGKSSTCHLPLREQQEFEACDSLTISPLEKDITIISTDTEVVMVPETSAASEEDVNFEESEDYGKSSDYDRPKFLQEMSPGDFTTGYGPRPPVLQV
ncbi:hypothetical protein E1301_Tti016774 [Triplophysa tibetana]|uniref:Fibronectin type-III domain-containing protein n=1 Tax=Triplophysa tibetana TaxID=1572043 RepID=A0A5A9P6P6_9TELE|nr:hypothetical protein E1301_Tti016774 [Triplophysa tibetana]